MKAKNESEITLTQLARTINSITQNAIPRYDYIGSISKVGTKTGYYSVVINQQEYEIKNGTGNDFKAGDRCLVHCISGKFNNKIIIAKL